MEIDLHGMELWEALEEILYHLEECQAKGIHELSIIHGYHGGGILKNHIQSDKFIKEMKREGYQLQRKESSNPGVSCFLLI
jgi:DNA-nicking Smr family endonuclease